MITGDIIIKPPVRVLIEFLHPAVYQVQMNVLQKESFVSSEEGL